MANQQFVTPVYLMEQKKLSSRHSSSTKTLQYNAMQTH